MADQPIVCTLRPGELNARASEMLPGIVALSTSRAWIEDGFHLEFSATAESLNAVGMMINAERQCCRFLRFQLTVEPDEGPLILDLTGPPGTQDFLAAMVDGA